MAEVVYIETSVVSYFTSSPSRDLIIAARQQETVHWWANERPKYQSVVSQLVLEEAAAGDPELAKLRLEALSDIPMLALNEEAHTLARLFLEQNVVPRQFPEDALHVAVAAVHGVDYLVTWNFRHINNATRRTAIVEAVHDYGIECPVICSPTELLEGDDEP